jgi:predicted kinase
MTALGAEALLVITGSMGSGKTTVLDEASDILALRRISHAGVDLDGFLIAHFPSDVGDESVMYRNLQCVWENYAARGVKRLLLARAIERREELNRILDSVGAEKLTVCRLIASVETMQERVAQRDTGQLQARYVARVAELNMLLDRDHLEDFSVVNEKRPVSDVAREMLTRAGWI